MGNNNTLKSIQGALEQHASPASAAEAPQWAAQSPALVRSLRVSAISSLVYPVKEPVGRREWGRLGLRLDNILGFTT